MNNKLRNNNIKNSMNLSNLIYLIGMGVITLIFLVIIFLIVVKPGTVKDFDDMKSIRLSEYDTLGTSSDEEYLIFVYSSKRNSNYDADIYRNDLVHDVVVSYANYVKENGGKKIYALDISKDVNSEAVSTLKLSDNGDVPAILVMKCSSSSTTISSTKKTVESIHTYLEGLMK